MTLRTLPPEVTRLIKEDTTDKHKPTETANIIKDLQQSYREYNYSTDDVYYTSDRYQPLRLVVKVNPPHRVCDRHPLGRAFWRQTDHERIYYIGSFGPSYWSAFANTLDHTDPQRTSLRTIDERYYTEL